MSFQLTPPDNVTELQRKRSEQVRQYVWPTPNAQYDVTFRWSESTYCDGSIFVIVQWEPNDIRVESIAGIILAGSASVIIGPRGYVKVSDYRSGLSTAKHRRKMANYLAQRFRGTVATGACIERKPTV